MSTNSFDERAATWDDDPAKVERADAMARAIRGAIPEACRLTPRRRDHRLVADWL